MDGIKCAGTNFKMKRREAACDLIFLSRWMALGRTLHCYCFSTFKRSRPSWLLEDFAQEPLSLEVRFLLDRRVNSCCKLCGPRPLAKGSQAPLAPLHSRGAGTMSMFGNRFEPQSALSSQCRRGLSPLDAHFFDRTMEKQKQHP